MSHQNAAESRYQVVVNDDGQYSLWPDDREPPRGWTRADQAGRKEDCLAFIEGAWTDMTPRRLLQAGRGPQVRP